MKCNYCNFDNNDNAKFCINCGKSILSTKVNKSIENINSNSNRINEPPKITPNKLVPAKCTNCGATLTLDPSKDAAICPFCNSAFIVATAIKNYNTINIANSVNINNYRTDNEWTYRKTESEKKFDLLKQKEHNSLKLKIILPIIIIISVGLLILWIYNTYGPDVFGDIALFIFAILLWVGVFIVIMTGIKNKK